jgi:hypothetical protein
MRLQNLYRTMEKLAAAVAFAEAGDRDTALRIVSPLSKAPRRRKEKELGRRASKTAAQDNRPVLYS